MSRSGQGEEATTGEMLTLDGVRPPSELLDVAVEHATYRVPLASPTQPAGSVRKSLLGGEFESAVDVAVLEGRELVGLVNIERLLATPEDVTMAEIMDANPPVVGHGTDQEVAAWKMVDHGESSLAVVDDTGKFHGLIPPLRMLSVLLAEHDEDLARLGGYMRGSRRAHKAAEERVGRRLWHRLPWLLIGLLGAMLSAVLIGSFEEKLAESVLVAFFVPGVVYMADAVGTQTEAVLIRAMAVGVSARQIFRRELITGLIMGVIVGGAFIPFAIAGWGDETVGLAVGLALFASCSIATVVAMMLPALIQRLGKDPAFGAGPLATVVQDILSIVVYFAVMTALVF